MHHGCLLSGSVFFKQREVMTHLARSRGWSDPNPRVSRSDSLIAPSPLAEVHRFLAPKKYDRDALHALLKKPHGKIYKCLSSTVRTEIVLSNQNNTLKELLNLFLQELFPSSVGLVRLVSMLIFVESNISKHNSTIINMNRTE